MATILDRYNQAKENAMEQAMEGALPMEKLLQFQELLYRTNILETCMGLCRTAPVTMDTKVMSYHYKVVAAIATVLKSIVATMNRMTAHSIWLNR